MGRPLEESVCVCVRETVGGSPGCQEQGRASATSAHPLHCQSGHPVWAAQGFPGTLQLSEEVESRTKDGGVQLTCDSRPATQPLSLCFLIYKMG